MPSLSDLYAPSAEMAMAFPETSMYRPDLPKAMQGLNRLNFGPRYDQRGGAKGYGWLGSIKGKEGGPMSEYSAQDQYGNEFPQFVPQLNRTELDYLLTAPKGLPPIPTQNRATDDAVYRKAMEWAMLRRAQGLSPFRD